MKPHQMKNLQLALGFVAVALLAGVGSFFMGATHSEDQALDREMPRHGQRFDPEDYYEVFYIPPDTGQYRAAARKAAAIIRKTARYQGIEDRLPEIRGKALLDVLADLKPVSSISAPRVDEDNDSTHASNLAGEVTQAFCYLLPNYVKDSYLAQLLTHRRVAGYHQADLVWNCADNYLLRSLAQTTLVADEATQRLDWTVEALLRDEKPHHVGQSRILCREWDEGKLLKEIKDRGL